MTAIGHAAKPKPANKIKMAKALAKFMCADASYLVDRDGQRVTDDACGYKRRVVDATACAECESTCAYGVRYLRLMTEKELKAITCGANCRDCRQPCNLYIPMLEKREKSMDKWLKIALKKA